jgi:hypothetical protein
MRRVFLYAHFLFLLAPPPTLAVTCEIGNSVFLNLSWQGSFILFTVRRVAAYVDPTTQLG